MAGRSSSRNPSLGANPNPVAIPDGRSQIAGMAPLSLMIRRRGTAPAASALAVLLIAHPLPSRAQDGEAKQPVPAPDGAAAAPAAKLTVAGLVFTAPGPWKAKDPDSPRAMTRGGFTFVPPEDSKLESVDADFYHFGGGQGGSVEANITRWVNQFVDDDSRKSKVTEKTLGEIEVSFVDVEGTFLEGPPFAPPAAKKKRTGFALAGVIIPRDDGPVFIKMTGPAESVAAARDALEAMVAGALGDPRKEN